MMHWYSVVAVLRKKGQPRKPRSALALFSQAVRPALLAAHPAATAAEFSRRAQAAWREADVRTCGITNVRSLS
jgi:hypothetical protein